jgi:exopolysaccharide biosynthesis polyprenyl glycosylphosphotransferase
VLARIVAELRTLDVEVNVSSGLFEVMTSRVLVSEVAGVPLVTIRGISLTPSRMALKRAFDLLVSGLVLIVGLPIWAICALLVKLTSPGPLFYSQGRIGRHGEPFRMYKFRTMYVDADARLEALRAENEASGPIFKMRNDPRVTAVGRWLRKFSIDEVPQVINVFTGEMSFVGPRPPLPYETREYEDRHWRRLEVTPGMTGLWQVSGRSSLTFEEMVRLDVFYIENWSVGLDVAIILRTVPAVLFARGAY